MAYAPIASIMLWPLERLRVGITYRGHNEAKIRYRQYITIGLRQPHRDEPAVEKSINLLFASLPFDYVFYFTPQSVTGGVAYQLTDRVLISMDLAWYEYSQFVDGKGNTPHPRFHDIFVPRVGIDVTVADSWHVYAGYFYEPSPVPEQNSRNDYLDFHRHVLSMGGGITIDKPLPFWKRPLTLQGFVQGQIMEPRSIHKIKGTTSFGPSYAIHGYLLQGGISVVFHY